MYSDSRSSVHNHGQSPMELVLSRLDNPIPDGQGFKVICPAHDDTNPSLGISEGSDGKVLVRCWAGCTTAAIVEALGLTMADLFPKSDLHQVASRSVQKPVRSTPAFATADAALRDYERRMGPCAASWEYHDRDYRLIGIVARWNGADGKKQIRPISLNGTEWTQEGMPEPSHKRGYSRLGFSGDK